jgi:hypothetical protein
MQTRSKAKLSTQPSQTLLSTCQPNLNSSLDPTSYTQASKFAHWREVMA